MIEFNEEMEKYKPVLEIDNIEESIQEENGKDLLELLQYIAAQSKNKSQKNITKPQDTKEMNEE